MKDWLESTLPYVSIYESDKELMTNIADPSLIIDEDLLEEVWAVAIVARSCLNPKHTQWPLMRYILKALENSLKVVREEHTCSARLRTTSSRGSWNAALFQRPLIAKLKLEVVSNNRQLRLPREVVKMVHHRLGGILMRYSPHHPMPKI